MSGHRNKEKALVEAARKGQLDCVKVLIKAGANVNTTCEEEGRLAHIEAATRQGRIQDLIRGGPQIMTGLKLPFWGLSFVEFWCWGLIFGGQGGPGPPLDPPLRVPTCINTSRQLCCL